MLKNECSRNCWLAAAVFGLLVWIFNGTFFGGLVMGLIAFFLLGSALIWLVCSGRGGAVEDAEVLGQTVPAEPVGDGVLDRAEQAVVDAGQAFAAGTVAAVAKGREALQDMRDRDDDDDRRATRADDDDDSILERAEEKLEKAGEAVKGAMGSLAARGKEAIGSLTSRDDADDGRVPQALAAGVPLAETSKAEVLKPDAPKSRQAKPKVAKPAAAKPKTVKPKAQKVKAATSDNLKEIKGVGPALETLLRENGVTSFAQIAAWTDAEIERFAELIGRMGGRIRSDDWVAQAKVLAAGGSTEFSRRVDKGEVY
ncbi:MAG: hypothetical protein ACK5LJ_05360 [Paracoccus sp. (in: a-proteobacteria)]